MAMKTRRTATVRTVTFTELLSLSRRVFQHAARAVPETAEAMVGYSVKRLRVALWKRVKQKVTLIFACNAFRKAAGMEPMGVANAERSLRGGVSGRMHGGVCVGRPFTSHDKPPLNLMLSLPVNDQRTYQHTSAPQMKPFLVKSSE